VLAEWVPKAEEATVVRVLEVFRCEAVQIPIRSMGAGQVTIQCKQLLSRPSAASAFSLMSLLVLWQLTSVGRFWKCIFKHASSFSEPLMQQCNTRFTIYLLLKSLGADHILATLSEVEDCGRLLMEQVAI